MPVEFDELVNRLEQYVNIRLIAVANAMADEFMKESSDSPFRESGFAILSLMMSYFEMIAQFLKGTSSDGASKPFFAEGFKYVYPATTLDDKDLKELYKSIRCGLYHSAMTKTTILSREYFQGFDKRDGSFHVNPAKVVSEIENNFASFILDLRDTECTDERRNFEQFALEIGMDEDTPPSSTAKTAGTRNPWDDMPRPK